MYTELNKPSTVIRVLYILKNLQIMNLKAILSDIETIDPEACERLNHAAGRTSRRNLFRLGTKAAVAAVPLAFGASLKTAYGQTSNAAAILEILNFALTLEYLEDSFYKAALAAPGLIPAGDRAVFQLISTHEERHVSFIETAIRTAGGTTVTRPRLDPTAKGAYPNVLSNYQTFLTVAQALEDTGVRAYKGQAANLISNDDVLQAALQIHSVEARHAAEVRRIRGQKPWATSTNNPATIAAVYEGEGNVTQGGVNVGSLQVSGITLGASAAGDAFDEPLTRAQVLAIATPFIGA